MINNPYKQFQQTVIETASQEKLILMMFEGAIKFIRQAREAMAEKKKYDLANENLKKAEDIVRELMTSLNMEVGEIARNLYNSYDYIYNRIVDANLKKDPAILDEVLKNLNDFKVTWEEVFRKARGMDKGATRQGGINVAG